jgi:adenylate kinase family enzyme
LTDSNWKKAIDFLMYQRREILAIQVLSPDELYPDLDGRIQMIDSEAVDMADGRNMRLIMTKKMVKAYQKAFDEYEQELVDFCASRGVTFFTVSSDDPIEKVIFGKGYETEIIK